MKTESSWKHFPYKLSQNAPNLCKTHPSLSQSLVSMASWLSLPSHFWGRKSLCTISVELWRCPEPLVFSYSIWLSLLSQPNPDWPPSGRSSSLIPPQPVITSLLVPFKLGLHWEDINLLSFLYCVENIHPFSWIWLITAQFVLIWMAHVSLPPLDCHGVVLSRYSWTAHLCLPYVWTLTFPFTSNSIFCTHFILASSYTLQKQTGLQKLASGYCCVWVFVCIFDMFVPLFIHSL